MGEETKAAAGPAAAESRPVDRGGENAGYVYDAFISYRHCPLDQYVAEILHKRLEAFRLPKGVQKRLSDNSRTKIERVFRDREELPLASNLAEPITRALEDSEFLIVICTPRLPESSWCRKEIETFAALHGREKILAAAMCGCGYDELRQRHRERRLKRILAVSCTAAAFYCNLILFSCFLFMQELFLPESGPSRFLLWGRC